MTLDLRQLRYLMAVIDAQNFTRAAEKVFVSQSALSQQIQALEREVGTILLDRSKRGVYPTAAGEILYRHAQRALLELEQAEVAIQELEGLQRGELRVGVVQTVNDYLMPNLSSAFSTQYPQVKLVVDERSSDDIEAGLVSGELQVGLSFIPGDDDSIATQPIFTERLALIIRDDHPLAEQAEVNVSTLDAMPMVMLANTFCTRRLWEESARLSDAQPHIVMEMNTVSSILAVVERTGLATILPEFTLAERETPSLVGVQLTDPAPSRQVGLLWHRDHYLCTASRAFIDLVRHITPIQPSAPAAP